MSRGAKRAAVEADPVIGPWELPTGWRWQRLGSLGNWYGGGTPSKANPAFWTGGDVPWVSAKDMKSDYIDDTQDHITDKAVLNSAAKRIPSGSVLCVMRSGILRHSFPVAVTRREVTVNQDLRAVHPNPHVEPAFLAYYLRRAAQDVLHECSKDGTTVNSIEAARLMQYQVPVPNVELQRNIVARIEELFAEIEFAQEAVVAAAEGVETYRHSLVNAAVTGRLEGDGALQRVSPNDLPDGWVWAPLIDTCEFITKGTTPPKNMWGREHERVIPFLRVTNLTNDGTLNFTDRVFVTEQVHCELLKRSITYPGDVLMNIVGPPLGQVSIVPATFSQWNINQAIARFRPRPAVSSEYLALCLRSRVVQQWLQSRAKATSGQVNLTLELCRDVRVPLPPRHEQDRIIDIVERMTAAVPQLPSRGHELRQSILAAAFRGDLVA